MSKTLDRMTGEGSARRGRPGSAGAEGRKPVGFRLPPELIEWLQDEAHARRKAGERHPDWNRPIDQSDIVAEAVQALRTAREKKRK